MEENLNQEAPQEQPTLVEKKQSYIILLLSMFIVLLVVAVGSYFLYFSNLPEIDQTKEQITDTSTWQTYSYSERFFKFDIKHPSNWEVKVEEPRQGSEEVSDETRIINFRDFENGDEGTDYIKFSIIIMPNHGGLTAEDWCCYGSGYTAAEQKIGDIVVGNYSAVEYQPKGSQFGPSYVFITGSSTGHPDMIIDLKTIGLEEKTIQGLLTNFDFIEIRIDTPQPNSEVIFPITIKGSINGNGWWANEGEAGWVVVYDSNNNPVSNVEILKATTNWLESPISFEATVGDREMMSSIETDTGYIKFSSQGQKDDDIIQEFIVPIHFKRQVDDASTWQTYRNEEFGFSIQYPEGFVLKFNPFDDTHIKTDSIFDLRLNKNKEDYLIINVYPFGDAVSVKDWLKEEYALHGALFISPPLWAEYFNPSSGAISKEFNQADGGGGSWMWVFTETNGNLFAVQGILTEENFELLSTFKFID